MDIRLIIFDLDGTLVDSSVDITNALNYAVEPYGIGKLTVGQTISLIGEGLTRLIEKVLECADAGAREAALDRFLSYYRVHLTDFTNPYPGVSHTLDLLAGFRKAVISNKREALSRMILENLGLARHFEVVWGSDSVGERKPSPGPVLRLLDMMRLRREQAIIVGDSPYDILAGKAAGIATVAVTYGYRDESLLGDADFLISEIGDLPGTVEKIRKGKM